MRWWAMRDSNPQPCACKAPALTVAPIAREIEVYRTSLQCRVLFAIQLLRPPPTPIRHSSTVFFQPPFLADPRRSDHFSRQCKPFTSRPLACGQATSGPGDSARCNRSHITCKLFVTLVAPESCPRFDRPHRNVFHPKRSAPMPKTIDTDAQNDRSRIALPEQVIFEIQAKSQKEASKRDYGCTSARDIHSPMDPRKLRAQSLATLNGRTRKKQLHKNRPQHPNDKPLQPADAGFPTSMSRSRPASCEANVENPEAGCAQLRSRQPPI